VDDLKTERTKPVPDNRVLPETRWVAALVIPFLVLAFVILVFLPNQTGQRFAWEIKPPMMAAFMGTGYLGGAYFFARVATGRRWHRVTAGFLAVTAFTWFMLLTTLLHWSRFDFRHLGALLWLALYLVTPILVPWIWWRNRAADPGIPEPGDPLVPLPIRWVTGLIGGLMLTAALLFLISPGLAIAAWPWKLTPLTARVLAGWFALFGVGALAISRDSRWSAWRIAIESMALWQALVLVAAAFHVSDFSTPLNWYLAAVVVGLLGFVAIYAGMERRQNPARAY
jgi:peptidoglycan/LPS O-acetylase OafA/YrhL